MYYGKLVAVREGDGAKAVSPQKFRAVVGAKTFAGEILIPSAVVSTAKVFVSFDNAEIASTDYCTTPRPIKTYADGFWGLPLVDWANKEMVESFKKATYVKIEGIECDNCAEVELRILRPSGLVVIIR